LDFIQSREQLVLQIVNRAANTAFSRQKAHDTVAVCQHQCDLLTMQH